MRYLITGGAGFIGSNFIRALIHKEKNIEIINIDKLTYAGDLSNLIDIEHKSNYTFIKEDICNQSKINNIFKYYKPDYVINFAAESHVDNSIKNSGVFVKTNILGTEILLQSSLKSDIKKYVQISTDEVYGSIDNGFFAEESHLTPNNPYAASKASADLLAKSFFNTYKLPVIITRSSNNYGPNQHYEKLIPKIITNTLNREKIPIYGDGENIRDWVYVSDHCNAICNILHKGKIGQVYNISSNTEKRNIDITKTIIHKVREVLQNRGLDIQGISEDLIEFVQDRKGHDRRYGLDSSKIKEQCGWNPLIGMDQGLIKTVEWYIDNTNYLNN